MEYNCKACFDTGCCCGGVGLSCPGGCCTCDTARKIRGEIVPLPLPGSTVAGRRVLAVTDGYVNPKYPDDEILRYKSGEINRRVRVIVTSYRVILDREDGDD